MSLLRWVASYIADQGPKLAWVTTHTEAIIKGSLSFPARFWWAVVRFRIWPTLADNTLTPKQTVLVSSILDGYNIEWARLIVEHIHESVLQRATLIPFLVLIYKLCIDSKVEILHHQDQLVAA